MLSRMLLPLLCLLLVLTALAMVFVTQGTRERFMALQQLRADGDELNVEWERLTLEYSTLADHGRVITRARRELAMRDPAQVQVLVLPKALAPVTRGGQKMQHNTDTQEQ